MILTFTDSGLLIAAVRGVGEAAVNVHTVLGDPDREFASSFYIKMEALPKAQYYKKSEEVAFYNAFFDRIKIWATDWETIHKEAERQARLYGLGAMDALHIAAALCVGATEFITSERQGKSLFRTPDIRIVSIHTLGEGGA